MHRFISLVRRINEHRHRVKTIVGTHLLHSFYHDGTYDGWEFDVAVDPAPLFCTRGTHRSDAMARMAASMMNEAKYDHGSM